MSKQELTFDQILYFKKILNRCHSMTVKIAKHSRTKLEDSYYLLLNNLKDELAQQDETLLNCDDLKRLVKIESLYAEFIEIKKGGKNHD